MCGVYLRYCRLQDCEEIHGDISDLEKIKHRGPDGEQTIKRENFFVGFTRLSIRAHKLGTQPYSSCGQISCFNGELYNEEKIRREDLGSSLLAESLPPGDMQLLGEMLIRLGPGSISRAEGMFAGFVFDSNTLRVTTFRDRAGEKPLYIFMDEKHLCISSELQIGFIKDKIEVSYGELFQGFLDFRNSREITVVRPATYVDIDLIGWSMTTTRYWNWHASMKPVAKGIDQALNDAVEKRLVAETKVCTFLSGGIDSAVISQIAARAFGPGFEAFTLRINSKGFDESALAQKTATAIGVELNIISRSDEELAQDCLELLKQIDIPILDTSSILTYSLSKAVAQEFKVALTGDGGDELFSGYYLFKYFEYIELLRHKLPKLGVFVLDNIIPIVFTGTDYLPLKMKLERLRFILTKPDLPSYYGAISPVGGTLLADLLTNGLEFNFGSQQLKLSDLASYYQDFVLPEVYLMKTDRCSMLHGLELRAPFLDTELIYFAQHEVRKEKRLGKKTYLRNYAREFLPVEVLNAPKHGFSATFDRIMRYLDEPQWNKFFPSELASLAALIWKTARTQGGNYANASWCLLNMTFLYEKFLLVPNK